MSASFWALPWALEAAPEAASALRELGSQQAGWRLPRKDIETWSPVDKGLHCALPLPGRYMSLGKLFSQPLSAQLSNGGRIAVRATSSGLPGWIEGETPVALGTVHSGTHSVGHFITVRALEESTNKNSSARQDSPLQKSQQGFRRQGDVGWGWALPVTKIKHFYKKGYKLVSKENPRGAAGGSREGSGETARDQHRGRPAGRGGARELGR